MTILGPGIQRFTKLTSLDLSCNNIALSHDVTCSLLAETLAALPELKRLDLSNNRLKHKIRAILSGVQNPLEYIKVCACGLGDLDIQYLSRCHHLMALRELDISENCLGRHSFDVQRLLRALSANIMVLEMEDCDIDEPLWVKLFTQSPALAKLRYLNISRNNHLTAEPLMTVITQLVRLCRLEVVHATYPSECYHYPLDDHINNVAMGFFQQNLSALVASLCNRSQRSPLKVNLKPRSLS